MAATCVQFIRAGVKSCLAPFTNLSSCLRLDTCATGACAPRGIVAEVRSADSRLKDAVGHNDSSSLSEKSMQLLRATLNNWGKWGSTDASDDSDDDDDDEANAGQQGGSTQAEDAGAAGKDGEERSQQDAAPHDELQVRRMLICLLPG
jgi:hypothetical protein